ncbi:MAG: CoA pyrophosphatase [Parvularculaceae bacterium]|nr:CoA pyrophosphatase [Parvularculaceae bacterium]
MVRASPESRDWRMRLEASLRRPSASRIRSIFSEMNPQLVGDPRFENRWRDFRQDAAVLIPIFERSGGPTILLTVRSSEIPSHPGQICFPGGRVHTGDASPVATALRETEEEVGISRSLVEVVGALGPHEGAYGFKVTPVVGIVDPAAAIRPDPREVAEVFEAPLSFVADLKNHRIQQREEQGVAYNIFAAPFGRYDIWGLTAGILRTLAESMNEDGGRLPKGS